MHMKERISEVRGVVIYCEAETASNLTTGTDNTDFNFNQVEADTMLMSA